MWKKLRHEGVLFPPEYKQHNIPLLYEGKPVKLTLDQEEVATMYAAMLETEYIKKDIFRKNFWDGFRRVLGKKHVIQSLDKCDFTNIHEHLIREREEKRKMSKEEKDRLKKEKEEHEAKYKIAFVDGKPEQVGNFRVEPPGLFRGRGNHPKMGVIKERVYPEDITINIGKGEPIPKHPYSGQSWKEVIHNQEVTWLAKWADTVNPKDVKYVFLAATSSFKVDSDQAKYEKARQLKKKIKKVRKNYEEDFTSKNLRTRQIATAIYLIDRLALRAGHEKGADEADTVGTCTLKVENVALLPDSHIRLDFLGKDSIRYENIVEVDERVYKNIKMFLKGKSEGALLFETFNATDLNAELKKIMDGLSAKVFRTFNASYTLDQLLNDEDEDDLVDENVRKKLSFYNEANKEVAILCNHQRAVPKSHDAQMQKLLDKKKEYEEKRKTGKMTAKQEEAYVALKEKIKEKESLKTIALNTSRINYLDPRITVAWCKRNEMPIEKIFNKTLLKKFTWAMETDLDYRF